MQDFYPKVRGTLHGILLLKNKELANLPWTENQTEPAYLFLDVVLIGVEAPVVLTADIRLGSLREWMRKPCKSSLVPGLLVAIAEGERTKARRQSGEAHSSWAEDRSAQKMHRQWDRKIRIEKSSSQIDT